jgi:Fic family protein
MNRNIFALVFLSGIMVAVSTMLISDYLKETRERVRRQQRQHFPDLVHLSVVEERTVFSQKPTYTTELQKPTSHEVTPSGKYTDCEAEAMKSMQAAMNSKSVDRATKLYMHAMALCPKNPKILNIYGEFLETSSDIVEADHLFVRAIAYAKEGESDEEYARALENRRRTSRTVEDIDMTVLKRIEDKKLAFQRISSQKSAALRRAKKEAYFQHIYHTVGIEGNTMSLAQTRSILETKLAVGGKSIMEHNEVMGLDSALKYINQTLVDKVGEISTQDILEIHKRVIGFVDPIEAGMIRRTQVYVGDYVPPHPSHIEILMEKFIDWLNSQENQELHPIRFAALAHYKLVYIHPFVDGNGRTSRLLMNLILMQSGYPPVIIRKQDRLEYYKYLETANEGDIRPFVRFIAECTERTVEAYIHSATEFPIRPGNGLTIQFGDESDVIKDLNHFEAHEKIIMGGTVGENITVHVDGRHN